MKLSKKLVIAFSAVIFAFSLSFVTACGGDSKSEGTGANYTVATDTTFAPFEFVDSSGDFVGIDMDILAAIAEDQGFEYTINSVGFDAALQAVTSGQATRHCGMVSPRAQEVFLFSNYSTRVLWHRSLYTISKL